MNPEDDFLLGPTGTPAPSGDNRFMQSLLGEGDYSDSAFILPFAYSPEGEAMLSFPMAVQGLAQGVQAAGRLGGMVFEGVPVDLATGLPTQDVVDDAVEAGLTFTGGSLLAPRPAGSIGMGGRAAPASIRAYHGSPHDFAPAVRVLDTETGKTYVQEAGDPILTGLMAQNPGKYQIIEENPLGMFDLSKIGTGEGAQAYGEGAYLSGSEGIARGYRDQLSPISFSINGDRYDVPSMDPIRGHIRAALEAKGLSGSEDIKKQVVNAVAIAVQKGGSPLEVFRKEKNDLFDFLDRDIAAATGSEYKKKSVEFKERLASEYDEMEKFVEALDVKALPQSGKMYEAEIKVGPEGLLDYDAPQSPEILKKVSSALKGKIEAYETPSGKYGIRYYNDRVGADRNVIGLDIFDTKEDALSLVGATGEDLLKIAENVAGSPKGGAELLREAGVPGLKYKAGGSRAPGMDEADIDRNYVIFDESLINILRKYGLLAPLVGGGTAAAVMGADEPQPAGGIL